MTFFHWLKRRREIDEDIAEEIRSHLAMAARDHAADGADAETAHRAAVKEFGNVARVASRAGGPVLLWTVRREERRLAAGRTYEPPTFLERSNWGGAVTS